MNLKLYDYSGFRPSRLGEPRFYHLNLLWGWVGYFVLYALTERLIPYERCHVIHCALDDVIPFDERFLLAYSFWYVLVFGTLLFFLLFDVPAFRRAQTYIIITQVVAMAVYILWPSRQELRPETFPRDNFLTRAMAFVYWFDTPTGVCPSLHVGYSLGILSTWLRKPDAPRPLKAFITVAVLLICVSVSFVKQHSVVDILAALPLCALAEWMTFGKACAPLRAKLWGHAEQGV